MMFYVTKLVTYTTAPNPDLLPCRQRERKTGVNFTPMETKYCPKCDEVKPLDTFPKNKSRRDGFNAYCKACAMKQWRAYRTAHLEECKARDRAYYAAHREQAIARGKIYRTTHLEQCR